MQFGLHQIVTPTTERILSIFRSVLLRAWSCKQTKGHGAEQCQDEAVGLSLPNLCNLRLLKLTKPRAICSKLLSAVCFSPNSLLLGFSLLPLWSFSCLPPCLPCCLPFGLGCCVRLQGLSPILSPLVGDAVSCSALVSKISCAICATVSGLLWRN